MGERVELVAVGDKQILRRPPDGQVDQECVTKKDLEENIPCNDVKYERKKDDFWI